jgi:prevent-host-death family protein
MKLSCQIKPISHLKAHAAEIVRNLSGQGEPLVITQNVKAKVVMQDIESYEQTQETMALQRILALGTRQVEECKIQPALMLFSGFETGTRVADDLPGIFFSNSRLNSRPTLRRAASSRPADTDSMVFLFSKRTW